ncbi:MAG: hypothetical protein IPN76_32210 [Saprospiraceae bacterium]|nr:hypothetical protein [Saprospiraceae bacterium]
MKTPPFPHLKHILNNGNSIVLKLCFKTEAAKHGKKGHTKQGFQSIDLQAITISWVGPGYKVRSQRNPVEPKSRGGVHRMPLLLRERRRCLLNKR